MGPKDLLEYISVCHWLSSDARAMYQSGEKVEGVPNRNVVRKQDIQVRQIHCIYLSGSGFCIG